MHRAIAVHLVACLMALLVIAAPARGAATEQALLVEAIVLLGQANAAGDPERKSELLLEARERLRRIVSEHAGGATASQLAGAGVPVVGGEPITLDSVERRICEVAPTANCVLALALQTAAELEDAEDRERALGEIAAAQAEAEDIAGALQTAAGIEDPTLRMPALNEIAAALLAP